jgi:hypothetical protein
LNARLIKAEDVQTLEPLVRAFPFKPYRHYRVFPRRAQDAVMLAEIHATAAHRDGLVVHVQAEAGEALAVARHLEWDSAFFGLPMARVEYVLATDERLVPRVVNEVLTQLCERGARHISARADSADIALVHALERAGFRLMDALVTYTQRPRKEPANPVREVGRIRPFEPADGPPLLDIARQGFQNFRGRFHLDPHIPNERCDAFYEEWARQCLTGAMADTIFVSEGLDGALLGFLAFRRREPVSTVGRVPVFGGGLGACRPDVPGAYAGLIRAGTVWAHEHAGVAECQTQNYNFPTIRIYEAVGARYVRAEYTLHAWRE